MNTSRHRNLWAFQARYAPYLFISPFVILFCAFMAWPLLRSVVLSLQKFATPRTSRFVGLDNYAFLIRDKAFWYSVANTVYFTLFFLPLQITLSLGLALLLNNRRLRFRNFFRFAFFSSHLVGGVFVAVIFSLLLAERHGLINRAIAAILPGVGSEVQWLAKPSLAMPAIVMASLWLSVGYGMIYFLAALQAVDHELYDAAAVDGASAWQRFRHITLPGIRPVLNFMLLVGVIGSLQLFELPYVMFQGQNPFAVTVVMYLFIMGFDTGDLGYASAVGWMLVLMISMIAVVPIRRAFRREASGL